MEDGTGRIEWKDDQGRTWVMWDGWFRKVDWPDGAPDDRQIARELYRQMQRFKELEGTIEDYRSEVRDLESRLWDAIEREARQPTRNRTEGK